VKAFLAGKRGVCPQCGGGLDIPLESQITKGGSNGGSEAGGGSLGGEDDAPELTIPISHPASPHGSPVSPVSHSPLPGPSMAPRAGGFGPAARPASGTPLAGGGPQPVSAGIPAARTVPMQPAMLAQPTAPIQPTVPMQPVTAAGPMAPMLAPLMAPTAPLDPIDEAPQAIWYVRPPSGGQYGPARGDVMRKWIGEGRVSPDSLVWREGWADWRSAAETFPSLGMITPPMPAPVTPATYAASGTPAYSAGPLRPKRRNSTAMAVTIVTVLGLMCVGLFVTLILVLMG
jgi:hypothetical protein